MDIDAQINQSHELLYDFLKILKLKQFLGGIVQYVQQFLTSENIT